MERIENYKKDNVSNLLKECAKGISNFQNSQEYKNYLLTLRKFPKYSSLNALLIYMQNPKATYVAGYNKWLKDFKRCVKKGEKGIKIFAPLKYKQPKDNNENIDKNDEEIVKGFKVVYVFDISQTEGKPIPKIEFPVLTGKVVNYEDIINKLITFTSFKIVFSNTLGTTYGLCNFKSNTIFINDSLYQEETIPTIVHELAHSILHHPDGNKLSKEEMEIEAESVSFIVSSFLGIKYNEFAFKYIVSYGNDKSLSYFISSIERIKQTSDMLINFLSDIISIPN